MSSHDAQFEAIVDRHYASLYRFAFSLTRNESDAGDLTQETFYIWARKSHQIRDLKSAKSWLFTTLYREHLRKQRRLTRFRESTLEGAEPELPHSPPTLDQLDAPAVVNALRRVDALFQAPIALFYLEDYSYAEIAEILHLPLGTVKSRISRGVAQLQRALADRTPAPAGKEHHE